MAAGNHDEALLRIADQLCALLGYAGGGERLSAQRTALGGDGSAVWRTLSRDDERLVAAIRKSLAKIAAAAGGEHAQGAAARAVGAALDGAELVIRGELASGDAARLAELMPGFVFLVTLPILEQDEALALSRRTEELVEEASG